MSANSQTLGQMVESVMVVCGINVNYKKQWKIKSFLRRFLDAFLEGFRKFIFFKLMKGLPWKKMISQYLHEILTTKARVYLAFGDISWDKSCEKHRFCDTGIAQYVNE